jgi:hypothetical protein
MMIFDPEIGPNLSGFERLIEQEGDRIRISRLGGLKDLLLTHARNSSHQFIRIKLL